MYSKMTTQEVIDFALSLKTMDEFEIASKLNHIYYEGKAAGMKEMVA